VKGLKGEKVKLGMNIMVKSAELQRAPITLQL